MFSDSNPDDLEKTTKMDDSAPKPKKPEKKPGDWITAPMPAAKPQPAATVPPARTSETPSPAPPPAGSEMPAQPSGGGFGSFLSGIGITDPNTQKWVLIGGGIVLALLVCCVCACAILFGLPMIYGNTVSY